MGERIDTFVNDCQTKAEKGVAESQYDRGLLYSIGKGVPRDYVAAHKWFNLAAMCGMPEARDLRAELAGQMTKEDVAEAVRQARAWLATDLVCPVESGPSPELGLAHF
ncbi:MAG: sel1 repeat family protein [Alphaproteobacteria bacterium]|nr:sel1 repeat family protein [Alphaproteobacteria bacterium]